MCTLSAEKYHCGFSENERDLRVTHVAITWGCVNSDLAGGMNVWF